MNTDTKSWCAMFDQLSDGILTLNQDWTLYHANPKACQLLNLPSSHEPLEILPYISSRFQVPEDFENLKNSPAGEFQIIRAETDQFNPLVLSLKCFSPAGQNPAFRYLCLQNNTDQFIQNSLQNEFLTMISHKLRTPIVALSYAMNLVLKRKELQFSERESDDFIEQSSYKSFELAEVIEKLIRYASVIKDKKFSLEETCSPEEVLSNVIEKYERKYQKIRPPHKVETLPCPSPVLVRMPEEYLALVFDCLYDNAVKFNTRPEGQIKITFSPAGTVLQVSMEDNGTGIPSEFLDKVFEPFYQVDKYCTGTVEGVGLGLPLVRQILKVYGQTITLRSELNRGTTLQFSLPISKPTL